jgi:hypothetical protein
MTDTTQEPEESKTIRRVPIPSFKRAMPEKLVTSVKEKIKKAEQNMAFQVLMSDLHYPVTRNGDRIDLTLFKIHIAYHLIRCGWRPVAEAREIKQRKLNVTGVIRDAVEWVPVDAQDDPLVDLPKMTMAQIQELPPVWRLEALRRMGREVPELPKHQGWHVAPTVQYVDEPRGF